MTTKELAYKAIAAHAETMVAKDVYVKAIRTRRKTEISAALRQYCMASHRADNAQAKYDRAKCL